MSSDKKRYSTFYGGQKQYRWTYSDKQARLLFMSDMKKRGLNPPPTGLKVVEDPVKKEQPPEGQTSLPLGDSRMDFIKGILEGKKIRDLVGFKDMHLDEASTSTLDRLVKVSLKDILTKNAKKIKLMDLKDIVALVATEVEKETGIPPDMSEIETRVQNYQKINDFVPSEQELEPEPREEAWTKKRDEDWKEKDSETIRRNASKHKLRHRRNR